MQIFEYLHENLSQMGCKPGLMTFKSSLKKGANVIWFCLSDSDHKPESTMMTHQMCLMDRGKIAFIGYSPNCLPRVCLLFASNLNERLEASIA
jgi:hypothetical protein